MNDHILHIDRTDFTNNSNSLENLVNVPLLELEINKCKFSRNQIPPSLSFENENMTSLKILVITDCHLVEIPRDIRFLIHLELLDLTSNRLTTICSELENLRNIDTIYLNDNSIKVIPDFFGELPHLTELIMSDNPLRTIPEVLLRKKSERRLNFRFDIDDVDDETLRLIYQYVPLNDNGWMNGNVGSPLSDDRDYHYHHRDSPMRMEELLDVDEEAEESPIIEEPIIKKLIRQKKTKRVPLKKGKTIDLQPNTEILDFIEGYIHYSMVPKENIILFQTVNELRTIGRNFLLESADSNSIVYECKKIYENFFQFTENELQDKKPYFRLRTVGLYGVVPLDQIVSIIEGKNKIYHFVETSKKLVTVVSHSVLYERGELVSASHCQEGQGDTVYFIETVTKKPPVVPITEPVSHRTRKRKGENRSLSVSANKKQKTGTKTKKRR